MKASELVLTADGKLYHLHITGDDIADDIILVGDPGRVDFFKDYFDSVEFESTNREMHVLTGHYRGHRVTAMSTGMGCDNIDIVMTELDVAANIDLATGEVRPTHRTLNLVRLGTCGSLHGNIPCGSTIASEYAIGMDGLLNYYECDEKIFESELEELFIKEMAIDSRYARPYAVKASSTLMQRLGQDSHSGITATAGGFYAPQGRHIRIAPRMADINERLTAFEWKGRRILNFEMETSALYGMAKMLGHNALTICLVIANRAEGTFLNDYSKPMKELIGSVLDKIAAQ